MALKKATKANEPKLESAVLKGEPSRKLSDGVHRGGKPTGDNLVKLGGTAKKSAKSTKSLSGPYTPPTVKKAKKTVTTKKTATGGSGVKLKEYR